MVHRLFLHSAQGDLAPGILHQASGREQGELVCLGGNSRLFAQSRNEGPFAGSLGQGDPYFFNLNQTKSASVTNLSSQTRRRLPVHVFVFLKGIHLKGRKKIQSREKLLFSNISSGICMCWRHARAWHLPSTSMPSPRAGSCNVFS